MSVCIRELAGWGLDVYEYRPDTVDREKLSCARQQLVGRTPFEASSAFLEYETDMIQGSLSAHALRDDLNVEMAALEWFLGVFDLRYLLAFQRRLALHHSFPNRASCGKQDWTELIALSFGEPKPVECDSMRIAAANTLVLQSKNPNLHFRISNNPATPITVHTGSPFFEVAHYRGRWFLRDGYHRAYCLLRNCIYQIPAVIVQARTLEELGTTQPWFFSEETPFSSTPPRVTDFLDDALVIEYNRPPLIKTLRVTIEEAIASATTLGESI